MKHARAALDALCMLHGARVVRTRFSAAGPAWRRMDSEVDVVTPGNAEAVHEPADSLLHAILVPRRMPVMQRLVNRHCPLIFSRNETGHTRPVSPSIMEPPSSRPRVVTAPSDVSVTEHHPIVVRPCVLKLLLLGAALIAMRREACRVGDPSVMGHGAAGTHSHSGGIATGVLGRGSPARKHEDRGKHQGRPHRSVPTP